MSQHDRVKPITPHILEVLEELRSQLKKKKKKKADRKGHISVWISFINHGNKNFKNCLQTLSPEPKFISCHTSDLCTCKPVH